MSRVFGFRIALFLVVLLAFLLRFYKVTAIPPSLNWDEASIGYNAYSILKTGKDEWGQPFPVHFKAYGEYKLPAQIYASIPGIAVFGLNELGVRITPVLYGTFTVLLLFFLGRVIFKNDYIGLLAAFLLAISPWHIQLTRASFESSFSVFWILLGIWWLVKGVNGNRWLVLSMIPFALSIYTYNSTRVFTPLFLIAIFFVFRKQLLQIPRFVTVSLVLFVVLLLPLAPYYLSGEGSARYKLVSVTDDPGLIPRINQNRGALTLPAPFPRLIHNKVTYISFYVLKNYLAHFNPDFLFISGAPHKQHHVQGIGELYLFQAPFVFFAVYFFFKLKQQFKGLIFSWLLIAFIPVSVTGDSIPHALRTLIAAPVYQLITAFGIYKFYFWLKERGPKLKWLFAVFMLVAALASIFVYLQNYYLSYAKNYSRDWQYGYRQVVDFIASHQWEYDEIVFSRTYGEPHMFTLFFLKYDPSEYQSDSNLIRFETYDWVRVLRFGKFYFPDLADKGTTFIDIANNNPNKKLLFIGRPQDFPKEQTRLKTVNFLNGEDAFDIVEIK